MTKDTFIDIVFNKINEQYPSAVIKYEYKNIGQTHLFEIPQWVFDDKNFAHIDFHLEDLFQVNFGKYTEAICFITENSLTKISEISRILKPIDFNPIFDSMEINSYYIESILITEEKPSEFTTRDNRNYAMAA